MIRDLEHVVDFKGCFLMFFEPSNHTSSHIDEKVTEAEWFRAEKHFKRILEFAKSWRGFQLRHDK
jgi:hypothetical protein